METFSQNRTSMGEILFASSFASILSILLIQKVGFSRFWWVILGEWIVLNVLLLISCAWSRRSFSESKPIVILLVASIVALILILIFLISKVELVWWFYILVWIWTNLTLFIPWILIRWSRDEKKIKYIFVAPGIIWILFFTIFPLISSAGLSLFKARLGKPLKWVGLKNFGRAFTDYRFTNFLKDPLNFGRWGSLEITISFVILSVALTVLVGLGLALLFNRPIRGQRIFRSLFILPLFTAPIALGYLGLTIFHEDLGPLNNLLVMLGLPKIAWISGVWGARAAIILVDVWQWTPFAFLVILAGLQALPGEIYEAARLDTSSALDTFRYITLPLISPVLFTVIMLRLVEAFKVMDIPFSLTQGGPGKATQTLSFYVYLTGLRDWNRGYASAQAYILLVLVMIVSMFFFARMRHIYED